MITGTKPRDPHAAPIELTTRGIQITPARIFTPHEVHFRMGKSFGAGRDLSILLAADDAGELRRLPSDFASQVKSIELVEVQQLVLAPPDHMEADAWFGSGTTPWQIRCAGPFTLDVERSTARLNQQVVISRATDRGTLDRLLCERFRSGFVVIRNFRRLRGPARRGSSRDRACIGRRQSGAVCDHGLRSGFVAGVAVA